MHLLFPWFSYNRFAAAIVSLGAAASITFGSVNAVSAAELEILQTPPPESGRGYIVDDGGLLSRAASGAINTKLAALEKETGFHVNVITIRKLVFEQDPFAFGDKVLETWYPTIEVGSNKGNLLLVKSSKEGAIVGGPAFLKGVGDDILDSILSKTFRITLKMKSSARLSPRLSIVLQRHLRVKKTQGHQTNLSRTNRRHIRQRKRQTRKEKFSQMS